MNIVFPQKNVRGTNLNGTLSYFVYNSPVIKSKITW